MMALEAERRVAIIFWEGHLSVAPSLLNALSIFASQGYKIDVVLRKPEDTFAPLPPLPVQVHLHECRPLSHTIKPLFKRQHTGQTANTAANTFPTENKAEANRKPFPRV